jgi:hypothetical protein
MRYVVEVTARVDKDGQQESRVGSRVYTSISYANHLFVQLTWHIRNGVPHRSPTGAQVSVLAARFYEVAVEDDEQAKVMAANGGAKRLGEVPGDALNALSSFGSDLVIEVHGERVGQERREHTLECADARTDLDRDAAHVRSAAAA